MAREDMKVAEEIEETAGLIAVTKNSETIHVHPTTLDEHKRLGWVAA